MDLDNDIVEGEQGFDLERGWAEDDDSSNSNESVDDMLREYKSCTTPIPMIPWIVCLAMRMIWSYELTL